MSKANYYLIIVQLNTFVYFFLPDNHDNRDNRDNRDNHHNQVVNVFLVSSITM